MQNLPAFNPTSLATTTAGIIYYLVLVLTAFMGFSAVYVLLKNGRSRPLSFGVSVLFLIFFLSLAAQGISILNSLS